MARSSSFFLFVTCLACLFGALTLTACRTPVTIDANLHPEPFLTHQASVTKDQGGRLFAVAARGQERAPFATVEHAGQTHLFWALPRGERAAQLLPLTRFDIDWYNEAMGTAVRVEFHDEIDNVAVSDSVGLWRGGSQETIRWIGEIPPGQQRAVVLPVDPGERSFSLADHIVGTLSLQDGAVTTRHDAFAPHRGPYLIVLDGAEIQRGPRAGQMVERSLDFDALKNWSWKEIGPDERVTNSAELQQLAAELGLELLIAPIEDSYAFGFAADAGPMGFGPWEQQAALVNAAVFLSSEASTENVRLVLRAMDDLYRGHPLSAAAHLAKAEGWSTGANQRATFLRHQDLIAAAGFEPWMRAAALEGAPGVAPEVALYLARAFAYQGNWRGVVANTERAQRLFARWPDGQGAMGMARSLELKAEMHIARGEHEQAREALSQAAQLLERIPDPYRTALVRRRLMLLNAGDADFFTLAEEFLATGARYEASRTLLLGVATRLDRQDFAGAEQDLARWDERFSPESPERLQLLARALGHHLAIKRGEGIDRSELTRSLDRAVDTRAWEAAIVNALNRQAQQADSADTAELGHLLVEGNLRGGASLFSGQVDRALGVICSDVVFSDQNQADPRLAHRCQERIRRYVSGPEGVFSLLEGGHRFLQQGEMESAQALAAFLDEHMVDSSAWTMARAKALLFGAALAEETGEGERAVELIQDSFFLLREALAPREAPLTLRALGDAYNARGYDRISLALYRASRQAASIANRSSAEFEAALRLAEALHRTENWRELSQMENVESPLHAARIDLYRSQAEFWRQNQGLAQDYLAGALDQAREFGDLQHASILLLAATLAMERGDAHQSEDLLARAWQTLEALAPNVADREEARLLRARVAAQQARLLAFSGNLEPAAERIQQALSIVEEIPLQTGHQARLEVLTAAAIFADDPEELDLHLEALQRLSRHLGESNPRERRDVVAAISEILIRQGEGRGASEAIDTVLRSGYGLSGRRAEHHCIVGHARLASGNDAGAVLHLSRCASASTEWLKTKGGLLLSLSDRDASVSYRAGLARHLMEQLQGVNTAAERTRLRWLAEQGAPRIALDREEKEARLTRFRTLQRSNANNAEHLAAAVDLLDYLLATAQFELADQILQSEAGVFYVPQLNAQSEWVRLRLTSLVRQLRPFEMLSFVDRAVSEAPPVNDEQEAQIFLLRAVAHLQAGQVYPAVENLRRAKEYANQTMPVWQEISALESTLAAMRSAP